MLSVDQESSNEVNLRITKIKKVKCTGCHACAQICPQGAITMEPTDDGFLYPNLNESFCINCGKCYDVCPVKEEHQRIKYKKCYSCYSLNNNVIEASSSGGIFFHLAENILAMGGVVFGSAFDSQSRECIHTSTDKVPLSSLLRAKYVQSKIGRTFQEVSDALRKNRNVLFCGTPCQVRALKNFLSIKQIQGSLITVDFMCHGVPSPQLFHDLVTSLEREKKDSVIEITFREKDLGWRTQIIKAYFKNGTIWKQPSLAESPYYFYFLNNYSLRDSCNGCDEYCAHVSDITLADDWLSSVRKNNQGTSLVFINSDEGDKAFRDIYDAIDKCETDVDIEEYSHKNYENNKHILMRAYKDKGYEYVIGKMYTTLRKKTERIRKIEYYKRKLKQTIRLK